MIGLFIFRRDFRIVDNITLIELLKKCDNVYTIFIFDPLQVKETNKNKNYISTNSIQFMLDSLEDLEKQLSNNINFYKGEVVDVLNSIKKEVKFDIVGFNNDYSPYSKKRDEKIIQWCKENKKEVLTYEHDNVLVPYDKVLNNGTPYKVFSVYYKKALLIKVKPIIKTTVKTSSKNKIKKIKKSIKYLTELEKIKKELIKERNINLQKGGRREALKILKKINKFKDYNTERDNLGYETTRLSAYLKFGCVSIREVYHIFKKTVGKTDLVKQLYWRSHYFVMARYNPNVYKHIEEKFKNVKWENSNKLGKALWEGKTGFPVIDAGVRELNKTGYMHNRARLLVANFSIKTLHIDPFNGYWGGQHYFSRALVDCCYANNYGNWLWILGPYDPSGYRYGKKDTFSGRVFSDIKDFKKWDRELEYIRKWIPELKDISDSDVKNWNIAYKKHKINYKPIVDFDKRKEQWYKLTKN